MHVRINIRSISTSKGFCKNGDIVDLPADEIAKIIAFRPFAVEKLPELDLEAKPAPVKRTTRKKANAKPVDKD